ncbi:hypothetical protein VII00023_03528 [Vibrio ichthyoenteri ATCC 700023]|uniref:Uncharacterized protein n=1 Tax=Vibrio ichthyoenteri ATCC 700023 TaxID=870968 RepID=F9S204_9VIBR|nr:hypothetical protein [Vibrio ichthyoenteri]EGU40708.1 hypothetical protein VII00023_03528 [Vibrio ichthyoenteri ATCC 700023]
MDLTKTEYFAVVLLCFCGITFLSHLYLTSDASPSVYAELEEFFQVEDCRPLIIESYSDGVVSPSEYRFIKGCVDEQPKRDFAFLVLEAK